MGSVLWWMEIEFPTSRYEFALWFLSSDDDTFVPLVPPHTETGFSVYVAFNSECDSVIIVGLFWVVDVVMCVEDALITRSTWHHHVVMNELYELVPGFVIEVHVWRVNRLPTRLTGFLFTDRAVVKVVAWVAVYEFGTCYGSNGTLWVMVRVMMMQDKPALRACFSLVIFSPL